MGLVWKNAPFSRLNYPKALLHLGRRGEKWGRMVTNGTDGDIPPNARRKTSIGSAEARQG